MPAADYLPDTLLDACAFLRSQLAPYPGRANVALRCVLTSTIVIVVSMALEVPYLALSLLAVFYVTQSNVVLTRLVGVMFMLGTTLAIGGSVLLMKFTFDYPLVRIVVASVTFLGCVYLLRILKIGIVFFLVALIIIYVQTFVDQTDQADVLIRAVLWLWVAMSYPIALTMLINSLLLPAEPQRQLKEEIHRQLMAVDSQLTFLIDGGAQPEPIALRSVQQGALTLQKLLKFAAMRDARYREAEVSQLACIATVSRLYRAAWMLSIDSPRALAPQMNALREVRANCRALDEAVSGETPYRVVTIATQAERDAADSLAAIAELQRALYALGDSGVHDASTRKAPVEEPMVVPDALTNPVYVRFSLKTLLAVLLCYVFYNAVDWQGAHTIMLTCVIIALPSLGASVQRAVLRVGGAIVGSALALFMVVFVIPDLDSITDLLLVSLPVIALGAWVAAGSERISYAGIQIVFTFSLALLERFGPTANLTEIRDRMVGILLGVVVSTVIQMSFWREGESEVLRQKLAGMLRAVGALLAPPAEQLPYARLQLKAWAVVGDCEVMLARVALEPSWQEGPQALVTVRAQTVLAQGREIMLAGIALHNLLAARDPRVGDGAWETAGGILQQVAADLVYYADALASQPPAARTPDRVPMAALERYCVPDGAADGSQEASRVAPLLAAAHSLVRQLSGLPDWHVEPQPSVILREPREHEGG